LIFSGTSSALTEKEIPKIAKSRYRYLKSVNLSSNALEILRIIMESVQPPVFELKKFVNLGLAY